MASAELINLVRHFADLNTDALLESNCKHFSTPGIEGFIGYKIQADCAIVFGEPVCSPKNKSFLIEAFKKYCRENTLTPIYTIVPKDFIPLAKNASCPVAIQYGTRLTFNPSIDPLGKHGSKAVLVRKKVKHAVKSEVTVLEYFSDNGETENQIIQIGTNWLNARRGAQIYLAHLKIFEDREGKRWFIAKHEGQIVGFVMLHRLHASQGWLLNSLITTKEAPHGTSELLIVSVFKALEGEKCTKVIVGPVVSTQLKSISGLGVVLNAVAQLCFLCARKLFHLEGQTVFWDKFEPEEDPSYVIFEKFNIKSLKGIMKAFNVGS